MAEIVSTVARPLALNASSRLLLCKLWLVKAVKKVPLNVFPPSFGIAFVRMPPIQDSAEVPAVSMLISWNVWSLRAMDIKLPPTP